MLYLEIHNGKEMMKTSGFQYDIGGMDNGINRIMKATKGCSQMSQNNTFFDDIWFSEVKTAEDKNADVVDYFRLAKTSHKGF